MTGSFAGSGAGSATGYARRHLAVAGKAYQNPRHGESESPVCVNMTRVQTCASVLRVRQLDMAAVSGLLGAYGLGCEHVEDTAAIPGSFWGDSEAGLIANSVRVRADTPIHSVFHEACHYICMTPERRDGLHTDAGGDYDEENAVCYLQIVLAGYLPGLGRERMMRDMDAWGYSFRLGSARAWFERDAVDARQWLLWHGLLDAKGRPTWKLRS